MQYNCVMDHSERPLLQLVHTTAQLLCVKITYLMFSVVPYFECASGVPWYAAENK